MKLSKQAAQYAGTAASSYHGSIKHTDHRVVTRDSITGVSTLEVSCSKRIMCSPNWWCC